MADHIHQAAFEEPVQDMLGHAPADLIRGDEGSVDEAAALRAVSEEAAGFHFTQHGGDGGVGELGAFSEAIVHLGDGGLALIPEDLKDLELQVPESVDGLIFHRERITTTPLILLR